MTTDEASSSSHEKQMPETSCGTTNTPPRDRSDDNTPLCANKKRKMDHGAPEDKGEGGQMDGMAREPATEARNDTKTLIEGVLDVELPGSDAHELGKQEAPSSSSSATMQPSYIRPAAADGVEEEVWELRMTWSGKQFDLRVEGDDRMYDVKALIFSLTSVPFERQKLIGLTKGRIPEDEICFKELGVPKRHKFTCVGTPEKDTFKDPSQLQTLPDQLDSFDVAYGEPGAPIPTEDPRNQRLVKKKVEQCEISLMNPLRPGKKLLVLDLDYTIVDTKPLLSGSLPPNECLRPGLHDFLEKCYTEYDIAVWSQTHWRWLESKLVEMGMIGDESRGYRIAFVADSTSMFPVFAIRDGKSYKHEVKPLAFLWAKFPQYSNRNTIHIDDLGRNFALNPGEGLKIRAFKGAGTDVGLADDQLHKLGAYLIAIAKIDDLTTVDHSQWKKYIKRQAKQHQQKDKDAAPTTGGGGGSSSSTGP